MDLEAVNALPMADQMTFLRGRILEEALSMEAVARYLHVRLNGGSDLEAALDTPLYFKVMIADCAELAPQCERLSDRVRPLALDVINDAGRLYERRNRFVHDALRRNLASEQLWELSKLSRPKSEAGGTLPDPEPVSAEEMVALVFDLIRTTWRLRGVLWSMISPSQEVSPFLTHPFAPQWDGTFLSLSDAPDELLGESRP